MGCDANIVDLGIDQTGVKLDRRGFIEVGRVPEHKCDKYVHTGGRSWEETAYSWLGCEGCIGEVEGVSVRICEGVRM